MNDVYCLISGLHRLEILEIVVREWEDEVGVARRRPL